MSHDRIGECVAHLRACEVHRGRASSDMPLRIPSRPNMSTKRLGPARALSRQVVITLHKQVCPYSLANGSFGN